ncbi:MAG: PcfJ-like protein [Chryseobacterium sp.]|nr:MAG: PcfJ-like protein [Chryseobacterium sp.]
MKTSHAESWLPDFEAQKSSPDAHLFMISLIQRGYAICCALKDMEIRDNKPSYWNPNKYNIYADKIFPKVRCLPIYKRNGFTHQITGISPYELFKNLLTDSKLETLLKSKQFSLLRARLSDRSGEVNRYWDSIKICIRQKYIIKSSGIWLDYMELLRFFGKDLRSPKYTCPTDLHTEHNRYVKKKMDFDKLEALEKQKKKIVNAQKAYVEAKQRFFGLIFKKNKLTVKVLESVGEFLEEATMHKHCVFSNEYYKKEDSLIFSAQVDGNPVETVEVSLSKLKIIQSRGLQNTASKYNSQIVALVTSNLHLIEQRMKKNSKRSKSIESQQVGAVA